MAKTVRLDSLRLQVRQRINREQDDPIAGFITDLELTQYINNSVGAFDDLLLQADAATRRKSSGSINVVSGTDTYQLPADFRDLKGVEFQLDATHWLDIHEIPFDQRNRYSLFPASSAVGAVPFKYYLNNDGTSWNLVLVPPPSSPSVVRVWYTPAFTTLVANGDTIDGINGLEEFIVIDAAIKCLQKEDLDASTLFAQRAELVDRIQSTAKARDSAEPARVSDTGQISGWDGGEWGDW